MEIIAASLITVIGIVAGLRGPFMAMRAKIEAVETKVDTVMKEQISPIRILFDYADELAFDPETLFCWNYKPDEDLPPVVEMALHKNPTAQYLACLIKEWHQSGVELEEIRDAQAAAIIFKKTESANE
jgi:hypothetical protein